MSNFSQTPPPVQSTTYDPSVDYQSQVDDLVPIIREMQLSFVEMQGRIVNLIRKYPNLKGHFELWEPIAVE